MPRRFLLPSLRHYSALGLTSGRRSNTGRRKVTSGVSVEFGTAAGPPESGCFSKSTCLPPSLLAGLLPTTPWIQIKAASLGRGGKRGSSNRRRFHGGVGCSRRGLASWWREKYTGGREKRQRGGIVPSAGAAAAAAPPWCGPRLGAGARRYSPS